ncbi:MAG: GNAT family N-acetyltransferase [Proteobacteria bacterium]|nr:GNAT family N-acetyltransferase [Pseudomonadota bacterium]MCP4917804.1 GNAT family N-acetyltransferase [Pseudomonadota bacterium]
MRIRPLAGEAELDLVARRMRATLAEVIGPDGESMYTLEWLRDRVRQHLDGRHVGAAFVAELDGAVAGHTIVRREEGCGLFSTTYVDPAARRAGIAEALLERGEEWIRAQGLERAATHTAGGNTPLLKLYERRGYAVVFTDPDSGMVRLEADLTAGSRT